MERHMMRHSFAVLFSPKLLVGLLSIVASAASAATAPPLTLSFGERSVTVGGVTLGGDVVCFAVAKEPSDPVMAIPMKTQHAVLLHDTDRDGKVVFELQRPVPLVAIWIAVDMTTGQWTASGSPGFNAEAIPPEEFAKHDNAGQLRKLSTTVPEVDALLVRRGGGAWRIYTAKTSAVDEAGRNERPLRIDVGAMIPLSDSFPKLNSMHQGDVLALIEPRSMRFAVVEVGK
jgi:hypothetical protein